MVGAPSRPRLVAITTTPLAAREIYTAVAAASFKIDMEAISSGRKRLKNSLPCPRIHHDIVNDIQDIFTASNQILAFSPGAPEAC